MLEVKPFNCDVKEFAAEATAGFCCNAGEWWSLECASNVGNQAVLDILGGLLPYRLSAAELSSSSVNQTVNSVLWNGAVLTTMTPEERAKAIAIVHEDPDLAIVGQTVVEEYFYSLSAIGKARRDFPREDVVLSKYGLIAKEYSRTETLSGGERHRLNCLCALEVHPRAIIADFSSSNLDSDFLDEFTKLLAEFSHDGLIVAAGLSQEQLAFASIVPKATIQVQQTGGNLVRPSFTIQQAPGYAPIAIYNKAKEVTELSSQLPGLNGALGEVLVDAQSIKMEGRMSSPRSVKICSGDKIILSGPNGIGKTTFAKILAGDIRDRSYYGSVQLTDGVVVSLSLQYPERTFVETTVDAEIRSDNEIITACDFSREEREADPRNLSRSRQKLVSVGASLKRASRAAILDEPTAGMTSEDKVRFARLLTKFNGLAILVISHDVRLREAALNCNWKAEDWN
jgi:energy-coupling factor transporter ATP-binding protein EcfA2